MTPAQEVFKYWQEKTGHPKAVYLPERAKLLNRWLKHYTVAQLKQVVDGWEQSDYHRKRGAKRDRGGPVYDDLELLFRSGSKIETFMNMARPQKEAVRAKPKEQLINSKAPSKNMEPVEFQEAIRNWRRKTDPRYRARERADKP